MRAAVEQAQPAQRPASASFRVPANLRVSRPGDSFEQEAERTSAQVMRMPPAAQGCARSAGADLDPLGEPEGRQSLQAKPAQASNPPETRTAPDLSGILGSSGQPLDPAARAFMEPRFGHDFSRIRVHTDAQAASSASAVAARAFTVGTDIAFAPGQYAPDTGAGRHLLAHELAHALQQSGSRSAAGNGALPVSAVPSTMVQRAGDPAKVPTGFPCTVGTSSPASPIVELHFSNGNGKLDAAQRGQVDDFLVSWHALGGRTPIRIDGYASERGDQQLNWSLSCDRALNTAAELMTPTSGSVAGVPAAQLSWFAHGETNEFSSTEEAPNRLAVISTPAPQAPARPQELLIRNVSGPTETDCGGYSWATSWLLARDSEAGGHIVQHIAVDYDIRNLLGMDITTSIVKRHWDYWEAWSVKAGEGTARMVPPTPGPTPAAPGTPATTKGGKIAPGFPVPYSAGDDTFADPDHGTGTQGTIVVTGDAQFYEGLVALPPHFIFSNPDTQARALRSTTTDPKLTGGTPNVDHDLTVEWDCRLSKTRTKIVSHKP